MRAQRVERVLPKALQYNKNTNVQKTKKKINILSIKLVVGMSMYTNKTITDKIKHIIICFTLCVIQLSRFKNS